ncbi:MAG: hypothetical protein CM1200mP29_14090 [Verrucomicrobiota bacterium]|nr:MAG: hypothetical protein CM1200mP29_14090 [Verrucomicrobiota bacterium]
MNEYSRTLSELCASGSGSNHSGRAGAGAAKARAGSQREAVRQLDSVDRRLVLFKPEPTTSQPAPAALRETDFHAGESKEAKVERTAKIIDGLQAAYPDAHGKLDHRSPLELLIATILSAQCTDKQVNIVTANLFKKYRRAADYVVVPLEELQEDIKRIGLFRNKAKKFKTAVEPWTRCMAARCRQRWMRSLPSPGWGVKRPMWCLGNAFGINEGIVVDTHVGRLARRLGLTAEKTPEKIELALQKIVPVADWTMLSHWLIFHGRRPCSARKPECAKSEIAPLCPCEKDGEYLE